MMNKTGYAPNENYDVRITGTTNMTTSLKAFSFAAKGHYYQLDEDVFNSDSRPKITDINGTEIKQNEEDDETYLGVERYSGVCLIAMERIFLNMVIYRDALFNTDNIPEDNGWFFPVTFIKRESKWSLKQVNDTFGPLVMGLKLKWALFCIIMMLGLGFIGLTVFCGIRANRLRKDLYPDSSVFNINPEEELLIPLDDGSFVSQRSNLE